MVGGRKTNCCLPKLLRCIILLCIRAWEELMAMTQSERKAAALERQRIGSISRLFIDKAVENGGLITEDNELVSRL